MTFYIKVIITLKLVPSDQTTKQKKLAKIKKISFIYN